MNSTQNERINQIASSTLIVGVDIAKFKHAPGAQDSRGVEFGRPMTVERCGPYLDIKIGLQGWIR